MRQLTVAFLLVLLEATTAIAGDHEEAMRVSKRLAVEVSVPACVRSGAEEVVVPVVFRNTSGDEMLVVWEAAQSVRVWKERILVRPGGWASQPEQWIVLPAGESTKRDAVLKYGEDLPALDEGNYTLSLDFAVRCKGDVRSKYEQLDVIIHVIGQPKGLSLEQVVQAGSTHCSKTTRQDPASTEIWELSPNMYPQQWVIRFGVASRPTATVCVNKKTGKASEPIAIP